jgi:hypothetical protein
MSPTLADVYMMTGLDITGSMHPYKYKVSTRQRGVKTGFGYKAYIQNHMSDGPLTDVEYRAFLNMSLCRFVFCGKDNEPTLNHIAMAEDMATGHLIPLGKYLLGSVYHMLHQTTHLMYTSQKIPTLSQGCLRQPRVLTHAGQQGLPASFLLAHSSGRCRRTRRKVPRMPVLRQAATRPSLQASHHTANLALCLLGA